MSNLSPTCPICKGLLKENDKTYYCDTCNKEISKFDVLVERDIVDLLKKINVGFRNEIRYRLEREYYHTVTDYAIRRLENGKGYLSNLKIVRTSLPGRKSRVRGTPNVFYRLPETDYNDLIPLMRKKLDLSIFISQMASHAGFHAQYIWKDAFIKLGYEIMAENVRVFNGKEATLNGDIDFIASKDGLYFGVEIKNTLEYPEDLGKKVQIAIELGTIPVLVVRRVSWEVYQNLKKYGILTKMYETAIYPKVYENVIEDCKEVLGYPLIAIDEITEKTLNHLDMVLEFGFKMKDELKKRNEVYLEKVREYRRKIKALDKELKFI